jgi:peptidyl-Asp metalloendopeptidase
MAFTRSRCALGVVLVVVASWVPGIGAQQLPDLISPLPAARAVAKRAVRARRARKARVNVAALDAPALRLELFDDIVHRVARTKVDRLDSRRFVWHGTDEDGGAVTLAVVNNVVAGAIYTDGRAFELTVDADGDYEVAELDPAAFPTEDPPLDMPRSGADMPALPSAQGLSADGVPQIDVMVLWTPAARNAVGGTVSAIQSLVTLAVANANLSYANSQVGATLRLVYGGEVNLTESDISTDLTRLSTAGDGYIDQVQSLRNQYGADVVTLIGNGYAGAGACGIGFIMSTTSTSFAPWAYNVVDQSCAGGYLSYAHEVGHNEGLQHDPANAGSAPSFPYAYGYQDPSGAFRTVMAYGGALRIPFFSSPLVSYAGLLTGTSAQDNARALRNNVATVASFMGSASGGTSCSYAISPSSLSFSTSGGSAQVNVTTAAGCTWKATSNASWLVVGPGGTGSGSVTLTATNNSGNSRSTSAVIAGLSATVSEDGTKLHGKR